MSSKCPGCGKSFGLHAWDCPVYDPFARDGNETRRARKRLAVESGPIAGQEVVLAESAVLLHLFADQWLPPASYSTRTKVPCTDYVVDTIKLGWSVLSASVWNLERRGAVVLTVDETASRFTHRRRVQVRVDIVRTDFDDGMPTLEQSLLRAMETAAYMGQDSLGDAVTTWFGGPKSIGLFVWDEIIVTCEVVVAAAGRARFEGSSNPVKPSFRDQTFIAVCPEIDLLEPAFRSFHAAWTAARTAEPGIHEALDQACLDGANAADRPA